MTPLFKKLNFKKHEKIHVLNAPGSFEPELKEMSAFTTIVTKEDGNEKIDFALVFATLHKHIDTYTEKIVPMLREDAILWFCYPKGTSKKYSCDFNRDRGWDILGKHGFEPVRQVAVDEDWSALRFRRTAYIKEMKRGFARSEEGKKRTGR